MSNANELTTAFANTFSAHSAVNPLKPACVSLMTGSTRMRRATCTAAPAARRDALCSAFAYSDRLRLPVTTSATDPSSASAGSTCHGAMFMSAST